VPRSGLAESVVRHGAFVTRQIETFGPATSRIGQTILQSVLAQAHLDQLLGGRTDFNDDLRNIHEQTEPWARSGQP
jgi:hypothetical protein